ncbi:unnamed protein product, partial [marine sediment metagenome]
SGTFFSGGTQHGKPTGRSVDVKGKDQATSSANIGGELYREVIQYPQDGYNLGDVPGGRCSRVTMTLIERPIIVTYDQDRPAPDIARYGLAGGLVPAPRVHAEGFEES